MTLQVPKGWDRPLAQTLVDELRTTFAAFPSSGSITAESRFNAFAEQLSAARDSAQLRLAFSKARQRATKWAPSAGDVREALQEILACASNAMRASTTLPPTPPFDAALEWAASSQWNASLVDKEMIELTKDWPNEMQAERERVRSWAAVRVYRRLHAGRSA